MEAAPISFDELKGMVPQESSARIRERVERARGVQRERFLGSGLTFNSEMKGDEIQRYCGLEKEDQQFFREVYRNMNLSARAYGRILKVARTIADLDGKEQISHQHLCEAISYRSLEEKYWNN